MPDYVDRFYNEMKKKKSFFPAANQITPGSGVVPGSYGLGRSDIGYITPGPDQNPAYQAALARNPTTASMRAGGSGAGAYSWITTPSGGQMRVPTGSLGALLDTGSLKGSQVTQIGNQAPIDRAAAYARGYGAPTPNIQQFAGGPALVQGGVANPVANLTPQQRVQYGVGGTLDAIRTNPSLNFAANALSGFGRNIASLFGGGFKPPEANQSAPELSYIPRPSGAGNLVPPPALVRPPAPAGIYNLVPPDPYVGRAPNERMFPTGTGGLPFPSANPPGGTVTMGNERFPGNVPLVDNPPYPTPVSNPIYNPTLQANQRRARRYSDYGYY